jgi:hypothetical protein
MATSFHQQRPVSAQRAARTYANVLRNEVGFYPFRGPAASWYAAAMLVAWAVGVNPPLLRNQGAVQHVHAAGERDLS